MIRPSNPTCAQCQQLSRPAGAAKGIADCTMFERQAA